MSTTTTYTGVRIVDMPDLGAVTDTSSVVGEHAGSGRFAATALRDYVETALQPGIDAALAAANTALNNTGRNLLHNPLFRIAQRGAGAFTSTQITLDRWYSFIATDAVSILQAALADGDRTGIGDEAAAYALQNVFTGSAAAGACSFVQQSIEGVRRLAGKTVTLSFWARAASGTPKLGYNIRQYFGTGGSPSATVYVLGPGLSVTLSTTWARYSMTATVLSIAGKTLGTNGDDSIAILLWFSSGATNNVSAGNIGVQSGTVQLWGMQLEIGSAASPLDKPDPRYDLSNCQRHFQQIPFYVAGYNGAGAGIWATIPLNTPMRAAPTVAVAGGVVTNASAQSIAALSGANNVLLATATVTAAGTGFFSGRADCSAEL